MDSSLATRMKMYEGFETERRLMPLLPVMARMDGRGFSRFTKGMQRPFDPDFTQLMIDTTVALVQETGACIGFTQSDEITLTWHYAEFGKQFWYDGRIFKLIGHFATEASIIFNDLLKERMPKYAAKKPKFDARVWNVPNREEGANTILWREQDATKNSKTMAASAYYSHKELLNKNGSQKLDMLLEKGVNWNDFPAANKRGTYVQRRVLTRPFTPTELSRLPEKHNARRDPSLVVTRSAIVTVQMPPFQRVANRADVIYEAAEPLLSTTP